MDLSDPRWEPMLERAMPADAVPGSTIPERTEAQVQLQDGSWIWCEVIGQRKDRQGRWCVGIRWYASPAVGAARDLVQRPRGYALRKADRGSGGSAP